MQTSQSTTKTSTTLLYLAVPPGVIRSFQTERMVLQQELVRAPSTVAPLISNRLSAIDAIAQFCVQYATTDSDNIRSGSPEPVPGAEQPTQNGQGQSQRRRRGRPARGTTTTQPTGAITTQPAQDAPAENANPRYRSGERLNPQTIALEGLEHFEGGATFEQIRDWAVDKYGEHAPRPQYIKVGLNRGWAKRKCGADRPAIKASTPVYYPLSSLPTNAVMAEQKMGKQAA